MEEVLWVTSYGVYFGNKDKGVNDKYIVNIQTKSSLEK